MKPELLQLAAQLSARGEPFVVAVVVRREPASSAQPGNMAIVTASGAVHGWLGGSCIQPTIEREARLAPHHHGDHEGLAAGGELRGELEELRLHGASWEDIRS